MFSSLKKPDPIAPIIQFALGESPQHSQVLATDWRHNRKVARSFWEESASVSLQESIQRANNINMPNIELLTNFINNLKEGLVLLTIHMGDYLHSILRILLLVNQRQVIVLRRKSQSEEEYKAFDKLNQIGHQLMVVRQNEGAAKHIIRGLRRGAIVIMLYDLPHQWGTTAPVSLFNQKLNWVMGPIELAMMGKSCVLPFFTYEVKQQWYSELHRIRDYRFLEDRKDLEKEMQTLAHLAEVVIRQNVSQWNHWHLLPDMLTSPKIIQSSEIPPHG